MRHWVTSPPWEPMPFPGTTDLIEDVPFSSAGNSLLFDFLRLGEMATGLWLVVRVDTGSAAFQPELSLWPAGPAEVGEYALGSFTLNAGQCERVPLGLDNVPPYVRLWVNGTATGVYTIRRIPR